MLPLALEAFCHKINLPATQKWWMDESKSIQKSVFFVLLL